MLLSRAEPRVPRRALVFSNLESLSHETMQACAQSDIAHSTLLFANHGGPAAAHLLANGQPRPARIDWWLRMNPHSRPKPTLPGCQEVARLMRRTNYLLGTTLNVYVLDDPSTAATTRMLAHACGVHNFFERNFSLVLSDAEARAQTPLQPLLGDRPPSTGFVAALHALAFHDADVPVTAIGFTGHCSQLDRQTGQPKSDCRRVHDYESEQRVLCAAGVGRVGADRSTTCTPAPCPSGRRLSQDRMAAPIRWQGGVTRSQGCAAPPAHTASLRAFEGRGTFFFGDSTSLYLAVALEAALRHKCAHPDGTALPPLAELFLHDRQNRYAGGGTALHFVHPAQQRRCGTLPVHLAPSAYEPLSTAWSDGTTRVSWTGVAGPYRGRSCEPERGLLGMLRAARPDVLVFNFGIHWLHSTSFGLYQPRDACVVRNWATYEAWLERVVRIAAEANITAAIFKATNRLCDIGWDRRSRTRLVSWRAKGQPARLASCEAAYSGMMARAPEEGVRLPGWCENASIVDSSSTALNRRAATYIDSRRAAWAAELGVAVAYFDDHVVQDCCHARDTIHHWELVWARLSALGDTLQRSRL